ncbi:MAG: winged helix-turn-helix domain-containing protein [Salinibacterium sp.]|nr:winged helix-turn-helix domain-containing protein [Salinibacterium sp.]
MMTTTKKAGTKTTNTSTKKKATRATTSPADAKTPAKRPARGKDKKASTTPTSAATPKRASLLDIAAEILAAAPEPMNCKAIVEAALASGRWTTNGKTPSATLYAAMTREIKTKGDAARFTKVDRGSFAAATKVES